MWIGYRQESMLINETDVKFFDIKKPPFNLFGLPENPDGFRRVPNEVSKNVPGIVPHCYSSSGVRVCFSSNSPYVALRVEHGEYYGSMNTSKSFDCGFDMYIRKNGIDEYYATFSPPLDVNDNYEIKRNLPEGEKDITIYFPISKEIYRVEIGLKESSVISEFKPYFDNTPVVFFGSSITQGYASSRPGNTYEGFISRKLNCNFINFGFSGNCKGQKEFADYLANIKMSAFVYDYDYNAPNAEYLRKTHKAFYDIVRKSHPNLPIILLTIPGVDLSETWEERRTVVMDTYLTARKSGDKNVYYIDGHTLFPSDCFKDCTADTTHPNDLGMYYMANGIISVLKDLI